MNSITQDIKYRLSILSYAENIVSPKPPSNTVQPHLSAKNPGAPIPISISTPKRRLCSSGICTVEISTMNLSRFRSNYNAKATADPSQNRSIAWNDLASNRSSWRIQRKSTNRRQGLSAYIPCRTSYGKRKKAIPIHRHQRVHIDALSLSAIRTEHLLLHDCSAKAWKYFHFLSAKCRRALGRNIQNRHESGRRSFDPIRATAQSIRHRPPKDSSIQASV